MKGGLWWDKTWNPVTGCTPISEGCENCWAARMAARQRGRNGYPDDDPFRPTHHPDKLEKPLEWKTPKIIAVTLMGDLFHEGVAGLRVRHELCSGAVHDVYSILFDVIEQCPQHTFLLLTKRPKQMYQVLMDPPAQLRPLHFKEAGKPLPNVWLGVTVENQARADERIPLLLQIPAAKRFVSYEPALGAVDFVPYMGARTYRCECGWHHTERRLMLHGKQADCLYCERRCEIYPGLDWIIAGGESGPGARPAHPDWFRSVRDQCLAARVPFFFKQWGEWAPLAQTPQGLIKAWQREQMKSEGVLKDDTMIRVGKKMAGALLDEAVWRDVPCGD